MRERRDVFESVLLEMCERAESCANFVCAKSLILLSERDWEWLAENAELVCCQTDRPIVCPWRKSVTHRRVWRLCERAERCV